MRKMILTPAGQLFIEETIDDKVTRTELFVKDITNVEVKNINPTGPIEVNLTHIVDEIDFQYTTSSKKRREYREKLRNELREKA